MSKSGKTLVIFLVIISILSLALTVIAVFFFQKESELRKTAEADLSTTRTSEAKLQADLKEAKKQVFLLEEKAKEANEKINGLMDDLELTQGVRDEMKTQNEVLAEALDTETKSKEDIRAQLSEELKKAQEKVTSLEQSLETEKKQRMDLESQLQQTKGAPEASPVSPSSAPVVPVPAPSEPPAAGTAPVAPGAKTMEAPAPTESTPSTEIEEHLIPASQQSKGEVGTIELDPIVVAPSDAPAGKILSVDKENDFVIFNLGQKDGIVQGLVMSIYRDTNYLGDIRVSRVQPEMSAADFVPPFSSQKVRKNDQVVSKR